MTARTPRAEGCPPEPESTETTPDPTARPPRHAPDRVPPTELDPFATFTEWAGPADGMDYADI